MVESELAQRSKAILEAMPEPHRVLFKETVQQFFPFMADHLRSLKATAMAADSTPQQNQLVNRYCYLLQQTALCVSLLKLGHDKERLMKSLQSKIEHKS